MLLSKYTTYLSTLKSPLSSENLWRLRATPLAESSGICLLGFPESRAASSHSGSRHLLWTRANALFMAVCFG